jgi:hypothetical protein
VKPTHASLAFAAGEYAWNMPVLKNKYKFSFNCKITYYEKSQKTYQKRTAEDQWWQSSQKMPDP